MSSAERGIRAAVGRAWWRFHVARLAECACLGLAAGLAILAAAVASGAEPLTSPALVAAGLSALACGVAWWHEQRRTPAQVAHRLDAGLGREGALVTAFECAGRADRGALEDLLLEREARELVPAAGRRAIAPPSVAFVAAPLIAAAVLSLALERGPEPRVPGPVQGGGAGALPGGELAAQGSGAEDREPDLVAARSGSPSAQVRSQLRTEHGTRISDAAARDSLRDSSMGAAAPSEGAPADLATTGLATSAESGPPGAQAPSTSSGSTLADGGDGSTMAGSAPGAGATMTRTNNLATPPGTPLEGAAQEPGIVAGRWWPAHYDAIVRDWTAARGEEREQ